MGIKVLVADDDLDFLDITAYALRRAGFVVNTASTGEEALDTWQSESHDIVLLDVNMAQTPGTQVCQEIRRSSPVPVILMSGNRRESEIIKGFEAGADDYVAKPFSAQHLVMRLRALYRRSSGQSGGITPRHLVIPPLVVDLDSFAVDVEGKPVRLTRLEFKLFYCLAANVGRVVATPLLIDFAWGMDGEGDASLLKTHFSHIRSKLKEVTDHPISIKSLPGAGYSLVI